MKFGFDWQSGFREQDLRKCEPNSSGELTSSPKGNNRSPSPESH